MTANSAGISLYNPSVQISISSLGSTSMVAISNIILRTHNRSPNNVFIPFNLLRCKHPHLSHLIDKRMIFRLVDDTVTAEQVQTRVTSPEYLCMMITDDHSGNRTSSSVNVFRLFICKQSCYNVTLSLDRSKFILSQFFVRCRAFLR